jgi:endonuclease/exonuclease/phosphatase (EEP) superfamily protein YafD
VKCETDAPRDSVAPIRSSGVCYFPGQKIASALADNMKFLLTTVVLFTAASSAFADSFCVATYNLNYANRSGNEVLDAIATANPDLICFQETTVQSEKFLRERLAKSHPYFYSAGHNGRYYAERFAFAGKSKLTDVKFIPPNGGLFGFYTATCEIAGEPIQIVNVHLSPFQLPRGGGVTGAMTALSATEQTHATEIAAIVANIDLRRPAIVLGDFNSLSTFVAPQRLAELGMTDAFASVHENADAHPTWRWPTRPVPMALRIDYIFHSHHFTTVSSEIVLRDGSDHALVFAVLRYGARSETGGLK